MADSLYIANGEQETDSSSFQLPPVERNEDIHFSNTDLMNQCIARVGHKAETVYNMLIVARMIQQVLKPKIKFWMRAKTLCDVFGESQAKNVHIFILKSLDPFGATMLKVRLRLFDVTRVYCAF